MKRANRLMTYTSPIHLAYITRRSANKTISSNIFLKNKIPIIYVICWRTIYHLLYTNTQRINILSDSKNQKQNAWLKVVFPNVVHLEFQEWIIFPVIFIVFFIFDKNLYKQKCIDFNFKTESKLRVDVWIHCYNNQPD